MRSKVRDSTNAHSTPSTEPETPKGKAPPVQRKVLQAPRADDDKNKDEDGRGRDSGCREEPREASGAPNGRDTEQQAHHRTRSTKYSFILRPTRFWSRMKSRDVCVYLVLSSVNSSIYFFVLFF